MKLYRLLHLMNLLVNSDKTTIKKLSEELEVSRRTIYRDLETLTMAGFPIVSYAGYGGGITIADGYKFDKCLLSNEDWENILIGLNTIKTMGDTEKIEYLIGKIAPKNIEAINEQSDIIIDMAQWYNDDTQELIIRIRSAINNKSVIYIEYQTKSSSTKRKVEPYKLIFKEREWYLYAYCLLREDFRLFKINRISFYKILPDNFIPKKVVIPSLEIDDSKKIYVDEAPNKYHIILEFELQDKEFLIEALGALNFKIIDNKGIIDFQTSNLDYTVNMVISLQNKVKVISPDLLYERVMNIIDKMKNLYER